MHFFFLLPCQLAQSFLTHMHISILRICNIILYIVLNSLCFLTQRGFLVFLYVMCIWICKSFMFTKTFFWELVQRESLQHTVLCYLKHQRSVHSASLHASLMAEYSAGVSGLLEQ